MMRSTTLQKGTVINELKKSKVNSKAVSSFYNGRVFTYGRNTCQFMEFTYSMLIKHSQILNWGQVKLGPFSLAFRVYVTCQASRSSVKAGLAGNRCTSIERSRLRFLRHTQNAISFLHPINTREWFPKRITLHVHTNFINPPICEVVNALLFILFHK